MPILFTIRTQGVVYGQSVGLTVSCEVELEAVAVFFFAALPKSTPPTNSI